MKALIYLGPGKKAVQERPKPEMTAPPDVIVKITRTTICGTDLHILKGDVPSCQPGRILGHGKPVAFCCHASEAEAVVAGNVQRREVGRHTNAPRSAE